VGRPGHFVIIRDVMARIQKSVLNVIWSRKYLINRISFRKHYQVTHEFNVALNKTFLINSHLL
jgi:hypothetical protein